MILIVDDAAFMRMTIKGMIEKLGHQCEEAVDGADAVEKVTQNDYYNLVTMDITMPNLDGIEALKKIRTIRPELPVVMCSAMGQEAMVVDAIKNGAKDFLVKPFKADRIAKMLSSIL